MKTENAALMASARESLRGKWSLAIGVFLVYVLMTSIVNGIPRVGGLAALLIAGPLMLGVAIFSLALSRNQEAKFEQLFKGFNNFTTAFVTYFLMVLFILLWSLLLIVPGIIAALSYAMTFYILADDGSIGAMEALKKSKGMMYGYKWKYFCLGLRFFGWAILCLFTLGIGFLWLIPYIQVTIAKFYDDLKGEGQAAPVIPEAVSEPASPSVQG